MTKRKLLLTIPALALGMAAMALAVDSLATAGAVNAGEQGRVDVRAGAPESPTITSRDWKEVNNSRSKGKTY